MFPLHLGAEETAQIAGLIATYAGASLAFRYGMMADLVLGHDVEVPDCQVWPQQSRRSCCPDQVQPCTY
jgi:FAD/FMN-containing dehydrogenase